MIEDIEFSLTLIRHGESVVNATPDIIGQLPDTPLSEKGKQQALLLRKRFLSLNEKFDYIYSSSYLRAIETTKLVISDQTQNIILVDDLREYDAGDWQGGNRSVLFTKDIYYRMSQFNINFLPPNGESISMLERRSSKWLEENILYNSQVIKDCIDLIETGQPPLNIAIFCHGLVIKSLLHYIIGFDKSFIWKIKIDNTSLTKLTFGKQGWKLISINDCAHLENS